ncbi:unnamed protein product [marine sediment metagenome]|uniref:Uncharacterized protein n=1 Tax=marine sediment metagenome TaxID=412755 RepID=X1K3V0_9ZZZZ
MTAEETIKMLEELRDVIPQLIFLIKIGQHKGVPVGPHVDVHVEDVIQHPDAQGHPEISRNAY